MFFLLRCVFWLSFVVLNLPGDSGLQGLKSRAIVQDAAAGSAAWCRTHGDACADLVLTAMAGAGRATTGSSGGAVDTLLPQDRLSRWAGGKLLRTVSAP